MRVGTVARHAAAFGGFVLLALLHTWPLAARLSTHLPGTHIGDNASFAWNVWWMREALARPDATFFYADALFAPAGASLVLHTHTALGAAVAARVAVLAEQVVTPIPLVQVPRRRVDEVLAVTRSRCGPRNSLRVP